MVRWAVRPTDLKVGSFSVGFTVFTTSDTFRLPSRSFSPVRGFEDEQALEGNMETSNGATVVTVLYLGEQTIRRQCWFRKVTRTTDRLRSPCSCPDPECASEIDVKTGDFPSHLSQAEPIQSPCQLTGTMSC